MKTPIKKLLVALRYLQTIFSRRDVLFSIAMLAALYGAWPALEEAFTQPDFSRNWQQDCDLVLIHKGLVEHPRFRDTLQWWTGTWVGQVPFWRPLTSLLFWLEWKLFGWEFQDAWMLVHGLLHLATCAALFVFADTFTGSATIAALSVAFFSLPGPLLPYGLRLWHSRAFWALWSWKDQPDLLLGLLTIGSCALALRRRTVSALALATSAAMTKETGFVTLPLAGAFLQLAGRAIGPALGAFATVILLAIAKLKATGLGFILGANIHWPARLLLTIGGLPLAKLVGATSGYCVLGLTAAVALVWARPLRWLAAFCGTAIACAVQAVTLANTDESPPWIVAIVGLFDWNLICTTLPVAVWVVVAAFGASKQALLSALAYAALAAPPALAPQALSHAYYTAWCFSAIAIATAWWCTCQRLRLTSGCRSRLTT
ncbi:MAG: hypothetical protein JRD89_00135 [Deltaproteobacteria bacterium]|nr:hypothetical protein [Deltaproteobacteria bacterium]